VGGHLLDGMERRPGVHILRGQTYFWDLDGTSRHHKQQALGIYLGEAEHSRFDEQKIAEYHLGFGIPGKATG